MEKTSNFAIASETSPSIAINTQVDRIIASVWPNNLMMICGMMKFIDVRQFHRFSDNFHRSSYETADVCQMLLCKYEPDVLTTDEESSLKLSYFSDELLVCTISKVFSYAFKSCEF